MRYAWEPIAQEHIALLFANDPEAAPPEEGAVLTARRANGTLAGWICLRMPGPHLVCAASSGVVTLRLLERVERLAKAFGIRAYTIRTSNPELLRVLRKLPEMVEYEMALPSRKRWFVRTLHA